MKVGLYLQAEGDAMGGSEYWLASLAHELAREHDVSLLHHKPAMTLARLAEFSGHDLSQVRAAEALPDSSAAWWPYNEAPIATARSRAFDLFITITHRIPPACASKLGVLIVLFPLELTTRVWPWSDPDTLAGRHPRVLARRAWYAWQWRQRFASYRVRTALSTFAQTWVRRRWTVESDVLYPPNDIAFADVPKERAIVSVGRFTTTTVSKAQDELVRLFRDRLTRGEGASAWRYYCLGQIGDMAPDRAYFARVQHEAHGHPIHVEGDVDRDRLKHVLARSRIYWHGAGLNVDEERTPHLCEHFGISTVEAMAAGAVPVVIRRGGQREIVRDGIDGFLCDTFEEMAARTQQLIDDDELCARMSLQARTRAAEFSEERSMQRLAQLIEAASAFRL